MAVHELLMGRPSRRAYNAAMTSMTRPMSPEMPGPKIWVIGCAAVLLLVGMAAGLLIGLVQALTQIQDQTVSFVPKILAMATTMIVCLPWLIQKMVEFARQMYISAGQIGP